MSTKAEKIILALLEGTWHTSRYALAAGTTGLAVAVLPLIATAFLALAGAVATVVVSILMLASAVLGSADPPIFALWLAVLLPVGYIVAVIGTFAAVLLGTALFVGLLVLPIALLIEILLPRTQVRSSWARVAVFVLGGILVGLVAAAAWLNLHPPMAPLLVGGVGLVLGPGYALSMSLFGTTLTMEERVRMLMSRARHRFGHG